jgi:hypothetical protein
MAQMADSGQDLRRRTVPTSAGGFRRDATAARPASIDKGDNAMTQHRRVLAGAIGLAILLAACGGSGSNGSGGDATGAPAATDAPAATQDAGGGEATEEPEAPEATEEAVEATTDPSAINDLASILPEEANGVKYERTGFDGDQLGVMGAAAGLDGEAFGKVLKDKGKSLNDVNFAIAAPAGGDTMAGGMIYAIQVEGLPATEWIDEMGAGMDTSEASTIGGKQVYGEAAGSFGAFIYPKDDTVFMLIFVDETTAAAILEQLP